MSRGREDSDRVPVRSHNLHLALNTVERANYTDDWLHRDCVHRFFVNFRSRETLAFRMAGTTRCMFPSSAATPPTFVSGVKVFFHPFDARRFRIALSDNLVDVPPIPDDQSRYKLFRMDSILPLLQHLLPGIVIPKPEAKGDFTIKGWGKRSGEVALIYFIPNHNDSRKPHQMGITVGECVLAIASAAYGQHDTGTVLLGRELPPDMVKFEAEDKVWIGQQFEAVSPVALHPDHGRSLIKIRSGMSGQLHHSLLEPRVWNEPERVTEMLDTGMTPLKRAGADKLVLRSSIQFGSGFISDLTITELGK
jgi:hypothetical protein